MKRGDDLTIADFKCHLIYLFIYLFIFIFKMYLFIYLFLVVSGLCYCARAFSSCGKQGLLFIVVRGLLIVVASLTVEHRL